MPLPSIQRLIDEFSKMPTIGLRTAERLAYYIARLPETESVALLKTIQDVQQHITYCRSCFNIAKDKLCTICSDQTRDHSVVCVVEQQLDIEAIENTNSYKGLYHVLLGALSPLDGITPSKLKIGELLNKIKHQHHNISEVILATNPDANGEATALYLTKALSQVDGLRVSRIGFGMAMGSKLNFVDKSTLFRALENRTRL